jgi:hypothetical protein
MRDVEAVLAFETPDGGRLCSVGASLNRKALKSGNQDKLINRSPFI